MKIGLDPTPATSTTATGRRRTNPVDAYDYVCLILLGEIPPAIQVEKSHAWIGNDPGKSEK